MKTKRKVRLADSKLWPLLILSTECTECVDSGVGILIRYLIL